MGGRYVYLPPIYYYIPLLATAVKAILRLNNALATYNDYTAI